MPNFVMTPLFMSISSSCDSLVFLLISLVLFFYLFSFVSAFSFSTQTNNSLKPQLHHLNLKLIPHHFQLHLHLSSTLLLLTGEIVLFGCSPNFIADFSPSVILSFIFLPQPQLFFSPFYLPCLFMPTIDSVTLFLSSHFLKPCSRISFHQCVGSCLSNQNF